MIGRSRFPPTRPAICHSLRTLASSPSTPQKKGAETCLPPPPPSQPPQQTLLRQQLRPRPPHHRRLRLQRPEFLRRRRRRWQAAASPFPRLNWPRWRRLARARAACRNLRVWRCSRWLCLGCCVAASVHLHPNPRYLPGRHEKTTLAGPAAKFSFVDWASLALRLRASEGLSVSWASAASLRW